MMAISYPSRWLKARDSLAVTGMPAFLDSLRVAVDEQRALAARDSRTAWDPMAPADDPSIKNMGGT